MFKSWRHVLGAANCLRGGVETAAKRRGCRIFTGRVCVTHSRSPKVSSQHLGSISGFRQLASTRAH